MTLPLPSIRRSAWISTVCVCAEIIRGKNDRATANAFINIATMLAWAGAANIRRMKEPRDLFSRAHHSTGRFSAAKYAENARGTLLPFGQQVAPRHEAQAAAG